MSRGLGDVYKGLCLLCLVMLMFDCNDELQFYEFKVVVSVCISLGTGGGNGVRTVAYVRIWTRAITAGRLVFVVDCFSFA